MVTRTEILPSMTSSCHAYSSVSRSGGKPSCESIACPRITMPDN